MQGLVVVACVLFTSISAAAQDTESPPTADSLRGITERGRLLAEYDQAAWHATDAISPLVAESTSVRTYVAQRTSRGWVVSFGRLSPASDTFYVAYEATQVVTKPDSFVAKRWPNPRADTRLLASAARAIALATDDFGPIKRPYNWAVLPAANNEWWVYTMPAQTYSNVWPLGGDARYRVSSDGRTILTKRRLHNTILEVRVPDRTGKVLTSLAHTAVVDTIPEDTDVFHVLARGIHVPELVMTDKYVYRIDVDGTVHLLSMTGK